MTLAPFFRIVSGIRSLFRAAPANPRERRALVYATLAFRREWIEHLHQEGTPDQEGAIQRLRDFALGAGVDDPLTMEALAAPLGELPPDLGMLAHWRIEAAGALAWALCLLPGIPSPGDRADTAAILALCPLDGDLPEGWRGARLRPARELESVLADLRRTLAQLDPSPDAPMDVALPRSRTWERARALAWVASGAPVLDDVVP